MQRVYSVVAGRLVCHHFSGNYLYDKFRRRRRSSTEQEVRMVTYLVDLQAHVGQFSGNNDKLL